ncbi:hypothetical protein PAXRUDRAFT_75676, partial [Paxillus rubicundulus Ve08.2h10]
CTGSTSHQLQERFQRSGDTISKFAFAFVLDVLVTAPIYPKYVKLPKDVTPPQITEKPKLFPFFKECRGAIDGSHITVYVPEE